MTRLVLLHRLADCWARLRHVAAMLEKVGGRVGDTSLYPLIDQAEAELARVIEVVQGALVADRERTRRIQRWKDREPILEKRARLKEVA